ncbi:glycogen synthase [Seleniivibrio woodruffii]|uniref:Glycogen synthase n=1 Tax=Seleniivibrio woodruffii TaxID=1078050 RepID=A0A4R1KD22_9BACT|nr:glycogen/starch synthase [Seleniivibrio woodruffii]TCK62452.1 glycogen synthase (ADP-glucose/UDP-glucose) [Seleniivibrio woodruffii]TVZ34430.1 starch synthase [Seleniivibrio woodruffii]
MIAVHITSEVYPFSRTGMLGDSVFGLAKSQASLGQETVVFSPMYTSAGCYEPYGLVKGRDITVYAAGVCYFFTTFSTQLDGVRYVFFNNEELYNRRYIYGTSSYDYSDNDIRYGMFCMASLQYIREESIHPDIIHCHEWQAGLVPVYKHLFYEDIKAKIVFTIHDITFQGVFGKFSIQSLGLPWEMYNIEELEFYENISLLKGGATHSDFITLLSPTYAKEVQTEENSFGLGSFMAKFEDRIEGILGGIDYDRFNPETDQFIKMNYNADTVQHKLVNKEDFLSETGLGNTELPLFLLETKFTERKGLELLADCADKLAEIPANFAILGYGEPKFCSKFKEIANNHNNVFTSIGISESMLHKAYAAADFVLRPSLSDPCGKSQMLGMRYGALPVVRRTGGLIDTVVDIEDGGYGFFMDGYSRHDLIKQINRAVDFFQNKAILFEYAAKVMRLDFSWMRTAEKFILLYQRILGGS